MTDGQKVRVYCTDCGAESDPYTVDDDGHMVVVGVERCVCRYALNRPAIVDRVIELAKSQKVDMQPNKFVEFCRAIENYLDGDRSRDG